MYKKCASFYKNEMPTNINHPNTFTKYKRENEKIVEKREKR